MSEREDPALEVVFWEVRSRRGVVTSGNRAGASAPNGRVTVTVDIRASGRVFRGNGSDSGEVRVMDAAVSMALAQAFPDLPLASFAFVKPGFVVKPFSLKNGFESEAIARIYYAAGKKRFCGIGRSTQTLDAILLAIVSAYHQYLAWWRDTPPDQRATSISGS